MFKSFIVSALVVVLPLAAFAKEDTSLQSCQKQGDACGQTTMKENYAGLADCTHSTVVGIMGGKEKFIELVKTSMQNLKSEGYKFTSYKTEAPKKVVHGGNEEFCIVPTVFKMDTAAGKLTSKGYLLGISADGGKNWKFVDGAQLTAEKVKLVFPNFPEKDLALPAKTDPVIEKK